MGTDELCLSCVKKHLQIDESFKDDDCYIEGLMEVAKLTVSQHLNNDWFNGGKEQVEFPLPIIQAMLLLIGNLYANREPVAFNTVSKVPFTYEYLLGLYKQY